MGHFHCDNISRLVVRQVYARGAASIADMVDFAVRKGESIHASEGSYDDRGMLEQGITELTLIHADAGILEPVFPDQTTRDLYFQYRDPDAYGCDWWDTRPEDDAAILSLKFRFAPGGRTKYLKKQIRHLSEITH